MSTILKIDNRELKLIELLKKDNIEIQTENLIHADIQIIHNDNPLLIIERKSISDLAASIKDGRFRNQKCALFEVFPKSIIYYIIEGNIDYSESNILTNGLSKKILISCIINMMIRDNIKIFTTKNLDDTANLIKNIYSRISEDPNKYMNDSVTEPQIVKSKNKDFSRTKLFELQLCQIPGISQKTATAISMKYIDMKTFISSISILNTNEQKLKVLKEITLDNKKRISSSVVSNIIKYLFESDNESGQGTDN